MKGLFTNQTVSVLDEETIVWGISKYKKQSDLIDVSIFEQQLKEIRQARRPLRQRIRRWRRTCSMPEPVWVLIGLCIGFLVGRFI